MSDTEGSDRDVENSENSENNLPLINPRTSLPIRFANPQNADSERPIADISVDNLFIDQTQNNEALLQTVNQTLNQIDIILENTDHSLQHNLLDLTIDMAEQEQLPIEEPLVPTNSRASAEINPENSNPIFLPEPLSNSGKSVDTIGLEAALKLLPHTFSGTNHEDLELFLEQCEFAILCANERAKQRLLQGIIIRLTGKARAAVKFRSIQSWTELKETLKKSLEPQRTTTHLYLELYSSKQKPEEDVMAYSSRIESLQTLILEQETNGKTVEVATALGNSLKAQTIQVFIEGLGKLKDFIKARNPPTLEKAMQAAREEERVRNSLEESKRFFETNHKNNIGKSTTKKPSTPCFHCGKGGHWARDCRSKQTQPTTSGNKDNSNYQKLEVRTITCRYCKKPGHTKEECRKLKYVTSQRSENSTNTSNMHSKNTSQAGTVGGRPAGNIKTAAISFAETS